MSKVKNIAVATMASALMVATPVVAASPGVLQGGDNTYVVKNVTQNGSYANSVSSVACNDTIKYSIQLSNTGFGELKNINVKATLGSTSNMTATPDSGANAATSGSVTVALASNQTLAYNTGSTQLYDTDGKMVKTLADGITAGGINVGDLDGSTNEFVNFTAKVNCPTPPPTPETPGKGSPAPTPTVEQPTTLPQTGAEMGLVGFAGTGALGYGVAAYRRSKRSLANKMLNRK